MKPFAALLATLLIALPAVCAAQLEGFRELRDGNEIARYLRSLVPDGDSSWKGDLVLRRPDRTRDTFPIESQVKSGYDTWRDIYTVRGREGSPLETVTIIHRPGGTNTYHYTAGDAEMKKLSGAEADISLGGSEFLLTDLGLEFLSWPNQDRPKGELRRGQSCHVLESRPAEGWSGAYSKVVSWIDKDSGGILEAEAYGRDGRLLKAFSLGSARKVNGVWRLEEMEMRNRRTGARSKIEFEIQKD